MNESNVSPKIFKGMCLHPVTLSFRHEQRFLEKKFLNQYFKDSLSIVRITCFLSVLLYAVFGILDAVLIPDQKTIFWIIRYAIYCPFVLLFIAFTYTKQYRKIMQPMSFFVVVLAGSGIVCMILVAPAPVTFSYYTGLILVFMLSYTASRLRFIWATYSGWLLILFYEIIAVFYVKTPVPILINNNFFFISANLIGMFACYTIEYYARRDFFMRELLMIEQEKVRKARDKLEERVQERTAQVVNAHALLKQEMAERIIMEKERKQIQEQLQRQQKMESLGLMAGGVAHDLNNILSGIIGYPELLLMKLPQDDQLRAPIKEIHQSGQRAAAVVADLLTVARGTASVRKIHNINTIIQEYLISPEYHKVETLYPNITCLHHFTVPYADTSCSAIHVKKCIMNLILNAAEAIIDEGEIMISTHKQHIDNKTEYNLPSGKYIIIKVQDSGPGISENDMKHIFEPFYSKKVMGRSGTGLGLSVVWNTMEDHKGKVTIASSEKGTCFQLYFPAAQEEKGEQQDDLQSDNLTGKSEHILIVDDNVQLLDIARQMLAHLGYRVDTVSSGEHALDFLKNTPVDLLVLDMLMEPGMNGRQTYEEALKLYPEQKAIIVSGFSESEEAKAALRLGASEFINKPYSMDTIGQAIKEALQENKK
ncbi:MAG: response regulator [Candidatus Electrothrix sp. AR3]|nr:response regulator [Candidatus Electrothrix sp. AR3]